MVSLKKADAINGKHVSIFFFMNKAKAVTITG